MKKTVDYKLFFAVLALIIFGMIMISSVSIYNSFRITSAEVAKGLISEAYNHYFVIKNISHVVAGMFLMMIITKIHYSFFEKYAHYFFGLAIVLLTIVLSLGTKLQGAKGWIKIPGIPFTIQPTEFLKVALIVFLAAFFKKYKGYLQSFQHGFLPYLGIMGLIILLVGLQPDFGTILVVVPLSAIMFFYAGANFKHLSVAFVLGLFLATSVYFSGKYDKSNPESRKKLSYITDRVDNFLADNKEIIKNRTINYQTEQALIAIGSGGFTGLGFGQSIQKYGYLPEVQGDFIFSVIIEELGFLGGLTLLLFYLYIGYRGFHIASRVKDPFAKFVALGFSTRIMTQAFINIGVNLNIVPLTGITMPFVSYGGSSFLSLMIGLGILLNISRDIETKPKYSRLSRKKYLF